MGEAATVVGWWRRVVVVLIGALAVSIGYIQPARAELAEDIAFLKTEMVALKKQCLEYSEMNARLEKRLVMLEAKLAAPGAQQPGAGQTAAGGACVTSPDVANIAKNVEISVLENRSKEVARDSADILQKVPDYIPNYFTKGLEFHGYFRSGYGINSKGGKMEAFQAPDALAKYRLGNEQETYIETIFVNNNWNPDPEGVTIKTQIRVSYKTQQNQTWDDNDQVVLREMYAQMGKFVSWDQGIKVWAGQRFCRFPELDINDFWWYDLSGYGGGFEDINVFDWAKMDFTYIGYSPNDINMSTHRGQIAKNNLSAVFNDIKMPYGTGKIWVNGGYAKEGIWSADTNIKYPSMGGVDLGFLHYMPGELNNNQFAVQYGCGSNTSLSAGADLPMTSDDRNAWRVRVTDMLNRQVNEKLCFQAVGVYQYTDSGSASKYRETWLSLGIRPIYSFTKHFGIECEPGLDYINDPLHGYDTCLYKLTAGIRITPGNIFNSRPAFRLFATYATWGDDFKGRVGGGDAFRDKTEGMNYGIQCENWW